MTRETDAFSLKDAFRPEPEHCHTALMNAARSAQEQGKPKRTRHRAAWIVAVILIAIVAVAFAVSGTGLSDWLGSYHNIELPQAAQEILSKTEPKTFTVGPIAFTVRDILSDGRVSYLAVEAKTADGSPALLYMGNADPTDSIGYAVADFLGIEGINASTSFIDAARTAGLPLYSLGAYLTPTDGVKVYEEMLDQAYQEDGSILLIDMLYTDPDEVGDTLTADVDLRAAEIDVDSLWRKSGVWTAADPHTIPVGGVIATKTYTPTAEGNISVKFKITKVTAEQTCAGVYVTVHAEIDNGISVMGLGRCFKVLDAQGNPFPRGISFTVECKDGDGNPLPTNPQARINGVQYRLMITADTLPDSLIVTNGSAQVLVEAVPPAD